MHYSLLMCQDQLILIQPCEHSIFATAEVLVCSNFDLVTEEAVAHATALAKQVCFTGNG